MKFNPNFIYTWVYRRNNTAHLEVHFKYMHDDVSMMEVLVNDVPYRVPEVKRLVESIELERVQKTIAEIRKDFEELNRIAVRFGYRTEERPATFDERGW